MTNSQDKLTTILKEVISNYDQNIEELTTLNNSALTRNKNKIMQLKKDLNVLITLDLTIVEDILEESRTSEEESKEILRYLETIKTLLKLNEEKATTFQISDEQYSYVEKFLKKVDKLSKKHQKIKESNNNSLKQLVKTSNKYKKLLSQLEDENDQSYIMNTNLLKLLFSECQLDEKTKRSILLNVMKYNQSIYLTNG